MDILFHGLGFPDIAMLVMRITLGTFFLISGFHKLFNPERHSTVTYTMVADGVPFVWFNCWFVPMVEFSGGAALVVGLLTPLAALGLFCVCATATAVDGIKRIREWKPIDRADFLDDVLYLPEVLYCLMLLPLIMEGAGKYSLDALL